jgi:hypothetical protein
MRPLRISQAVRSATPHAIVAVLGALVADVHADPGADSCSIGIASAPPALREVDRRVEVVPPCSAAQNVFAA